MAALYEAYTLCGLVPWQNSTDSGIQGIEPDGDEDRVIVTDCTRSVTVYKVINKPDVSVARAVSLACKHCCKQRHIKAV